MFFFQFSFHFISFIRVKIRKLKKKETKKIQEKKRKKEDEKKGFCEKNEVFC